MDRALYKSPIGILEILCENNELISLKLVTYTSKSSTETVFITNIKNQLNEYFLGKRKIFNIKINTKGTEFQKKVWNELQKIPFGQTKSYSDIAKNIGNPKAQRAVGSACNKNPILIFVPCHRVIAKNKKLGGFAYGSHIKQKLLKIENCI